MPEHSTPKEEPIEFDFPSSTKSTAFVRCFLCGFRQDFIAELPYGMEFERASSSLQKTLLEMATSHAQEKHPEEYRKYAKAEK